MERRDFELGDWLFWVWSVCILFGVVNNGLLLLGFEWGVLLLLLSVLLSGLLAYLIVSVIIWLI